MYINHAVFIILSFVINRVLCFQVTKRLVYTSKCQIRFQLSMSRKDLIIGVNKYSHDASCCIVDAKTGEILFTQAKERITSKKHDSGSIHSIVKYGLSSIHADINDVKYVVSNNHHYRVQPFDQRIKLNKALKYIPEEYDNEYNLFPNAIHYELSHHLAHAWSVVSTAPFKQGVIVVMDGMGESYKAMMEDMLGVETYSGDYMHDLKILKSFNGKIPFIGQPISLSPGSTYREAESAYVFDRETCMLRPVFKRWSRERSPSELYNHGFENMESIGAVYSRISSHILGDWNACGKIMGLAPWADKKKEDASDGWYFDKKEMNKLNIGLDFHHKQQIMTGNPLLDNSFVINWDLLDNLSPINKWDDSRFSELANLAASVQNDLEQVAVEFCSTLREATGEKNIALVGGVALNSVMNSQIRNECGYEKLYIPPAPGDEGIAIGCAMYGLQRVRELEEFKRKQQQQQQEVEASTDTAIIGSNIFDFPRTKVESLITQSDPAYIEESFNDNKLMKSNTNTNNQATTNTATASSNIKEDINIIKILQQPFPAYQGRLFTQEDIETVLYDMDPWITVESFESEDSLITEAAKDISEGHIIAWFQGKSEFGQRALGARSILADPRRKEYRIVINEKVKEREWYRPLAPSVLDDYAGDWFLELENNQNASPYMSLTATVSPDKRDLVPAICHVDHTARLQTVTNTEAPLYHSLIKAFYKLTGIPMILNTSFNRKSQPIVETPLQAIQTLLSCNGNIQYLYMGLNKISIKPLPFDSYLPIKTNSFENNDKNPSEREGNIIVRTSPLYMSEVTSSVVSGSNTVLRVRIQDGGVSSATDPSISDHYHSDTATTSSSYEQQNEWRILPTELHLEILQLLQPQTLPNQDEFDSSYQEYDVLVDELLSILRSMRDSTSSTENNNGSDDDTILHYNNNEELLSWDQLKQALQWLYMNQLIAFEDPSEKSFKDLLSSSEVVDLRSFG